MIRSVLLLALFWVLLGTTPRAPAAPPYRDASFLSLQLSRAAPPPEAHVTHQTYPGASVVRKPGGVPTVRSSLPGYGGSGTCPVLPAAVYPSDLFPRLVRIALRFRRSSAPCVSVATLSASPRAPPFS